MFPPLPLKFASAFHISFPRALWNFWELSLFARSSYSYSLIYSDLVIYPPTFFQLFNCVLELSYLFSLSLQCASTFYISFAIALCNHHALPLFFQGLSVFSNTLHAVISSQRGLPGIYDLRVKGKFPLDFQKKTQAAPLP